jgi:S-adenosylmethionine:diacylglycerol 3-amino-3-carboxypropyl transferase
MTVRPKFAVVREDAALEVELVRRSSAREVLIVASGGCTALTLRHLFPTLEVTAFDLNPADLRTCGEALVARGQSAIACFAIDEQLADHVTWLAGEGLRPDSTCTVYSLALPFSRVRAGWVHLPTSEI